VYNSFELLGCPLPPQLVIETHSSIPIATIAAVARLLRRGRFTATIATKGAPISPTIAAIMPVELDVTVLIVAVELCALPFNVSVEASTEQLA
jgi:hypothetical protein